MTENKKYDFGVNIEEMMAAGVHLGHHVSKLNPKMKQYVSGLRNNSHIIDAEKAAEMLVGALKFVEKLITEQKILLLVGTKIQLKNLVKDTAKDCGLFYVSERWLGGTFTNFKTILKRVNYFKELEEKKAKGELEKYTKKERMKIDKEIERLKNNFEGIKNMEKLPDAIFVVDIKKDSLAVKEARKKGVKTIGIVDTNSDPTSVDYPISASDDSISSVKYILEKVAEVVKKVKK